MSPILKNVLAALGVVLLILVALHLFAAPMMAHVARYIHGL